MKDDRPANTPLLSEAVGRRVVDMSLEYDLAPPCATQAKWDAGVMADWVNSLAPWSVISHLTFAWECSLNAAQKAYERYMSRHYSRVSYFYALEQNPSRCGYHVHALWADTGGVYRREAWNKWFKRYGRARIEPVRRYEDVSRYCAKYVTKEGAWWNVSLQWHHRQRMWKRDYKLENGS